MDNPELNESSQELRRWTQECAALLAPPADWEPDLSGARDHMEARLHRRSRLKRYLLVGAMAGVLAWGLVPAIPPVGAFAQQAAGNGWYRAEQLWCWITIVWRGPIKLSLRGLPEAVKSFRTHPLIEPGASQAVSDGAEAARLVGFIPRFPRSGVLFERPRLSVRDPMSFGAVIRTTDLELALRNARVLDQDVPKNWDGAEIALQIGATVTAQWSNVREEWSELTLAQGLPPLVATPPGFDLAAFTILNLRTARLNRENALRFSRYATTAPALLLANGAQDWAGVQEVSLRTGPATLVEGFYNGHVERIVLLWSVPDRVYVLTGTVSVPSDVASIDLAGAVASAIRLANTID